jgi:hypothetical protein
MRRSVSWPGHLPGRYGQCFAWSVSVHWKCQRIKPAINYDNCIISYTFQFIICPYLVIRRCTLWITDSVVRKMKASFSGWNLFCQNKNTAGIFCHLVRERCMLLSFSGSVSCKQISCYNMFSWVWCCLRLSCHFKNSEQKPKEKFEWIEVKFLTWIVLIQSNNGNVIFLWHATELKSAPSEGTE